jgi:hypothetical protein
MRTILGLAIASCVSIVASGRTARADCTVEDKPGPIAHVEFIEGKRVVVIDRKIECTTTVPRPGVVYVVNPQTIHYAWEDIRADLMPVILATVKKAPF